MKKIFTLFFICLTFFAKAQTYQFIDGGSVIKIHKNGILQQSFTKDELQFYKSSGSQGVLNSALRITQGILQIGEFDYNKINQPSSPTIDSLIAILNSYIPTTGTYRDSLYKNSTRDSIIHVSSFGIRTAVKDSSGGGTVTPAALTKTDDTNVTLTLGGTPSTALLQATSLTLGWTGTLADARIASAATWNAKQAALVSGTNIKTVGSTSLLGSGDIALNYVALDGSTTGATSSQQPFTKGVNSIGTNMKFIGLADSLYEGNGSIGYFRALPSGQVYIKDSDNVSTSVYPLTIETNKSNGRAVLVKSNQVASLIDFTTSGGNNVAIGSSNSGDPCKFCVVDNVTGLHQELQIDGRPSFRSDQVYIYLDMLCTASHYSFGPRLTQWELTNETTGHAPITVSSTDGVRISGDATYSDAAASAALDVVSTTKGILIPRWTNAQMAAISSPATGLKGYNTDAGMTMDYSGSAYKSAGIVSGSYSSGAVVAQATFTITFGGTQPNTTYKVNVTPSDLLGAAVFYVNNKTTTTFDVVFLSGLTGTLTMDYIVSQ